MREKTNFVHGYSGVSKDTGAISFPIYQGVTFAHPALGENTRGFAYARADSPTRQEFERSLALLEHGVRAWAFSSGMAAISVFIKLFDVGDHLIVSEDLYGGTYRLFTEVYEKYGLTFDYVDTSSPEKVNAAIKPNTKGIFIETPSNPLMHVTDIKAVAERMKEIGAVVAVDNTFLSPYFQKPLDLGADFVIHSATKYIGGHNDVLAGALIVKDEKWIEPIFTMAMSEGGTLGPSDSWLLLRSLKTLTVRMERQQENAIRIVEYMKKHPKIKRVFYVGDENHPDREVTLKQTTGFGGMISFALKNGEKVPEILKRFQVITFAESLGGVESLITYPMIQTHGAIPKEMRERLGVNDKLLRLSVGIEDVDDLIEDLEQALSI
ncbi:cystathionine gamma-synthase [Kineothrix alysoides]|uniref:Cystathionine gamma-synthase n=1 Tax=Kineothrix alysoides TaxID=1469948 RepID=A0A4R1R3K9_9FIRM|nr:PLP-dependent aspartate aminotransferase family protein [Kineothrix alysoides]TCL60013.1 cystathionine gamma-synthase [Kineothrix alysoides]